MSTIILMQLLTPSSDSAGERHVRHGSNYMKGDSITLELAAKAADQYDKEITDSSLKKKNILLEKSVRRDPIYEIGALVLVSFERPDTSGQNRRGSLVWKGPYTVVSKSLNGIYDLRDNDGAMFEHAVDRLKPFKIADLKT